MLTPAPFADPRKMSKTHMSGQSAAVARSARPAKRAKLANDVRPMMYGFGDSVQPLDESVDLVEDIVIDFLTNLTQQAVEHNGGEPSKLRVEDMLFAIRKDRPKYNRARELLACDKLIRMYRKTAAPKMKNAAVKEQSKEVTFSESADKQR